MFHYSPGLSTDSSRNKFQDHVSGQLNARAGHGIVADIAWFMEAGFFHK